MGSEYCPPGRQAAAARRPIDAAAYAFALHDLPSPGGADARQDQRHLASVRRAASGSWAMAMSTGVCRHLARSRSTDAS